MPAATSFAAFTIIGVSRPRNGSLGSHGGPWSGSRYPAPMVGPASLDSAQRPARHEPPRPGQPPPPRCAGDGARDARRARPLGVKRAPCRATRPGRAGGMMATAGHYRPRPVRPEPAATPAGADTLQWRSRKMCETQYSSTMYGIRHRVGISPLSPADRVIRSISIHEIGPERE
jgi:hypothetical protein